jgi:hypothetical protein
MSGIMTFADVPGAPRDTGPTLGTDEQIELHGARAAKLDLAHPAATVPAAQAHLRLSSLHFGRVRALSGGSAQPVETIS